MLRSVRAVRPGRLDVAITAVLTAAGVVLMVTNVTDPKLQASPLIVPAFILV
jgi:hypothetical protein